MKIQAQTKQPLAALTVDGTNSGAPDPGKLPKTPKIRLAKRRPSKSPGEISDSDAGTKGSGRVSLEYLNSAAQRVFIAGTFNDWNPCAHALTALEHGKWAVELTLEPGRYEYRLVVDDQWTDDPRATEQIANPYGGTNSVLQV